MTGAVFVAGLADSGKTPFRRMLTEHTSIVITRHTQLWRRFAGEFGDLRNEDNLERCLSALREDRAVQKLRWDTDRLRAMLSDMEPTSTAVFSSVHAQHAERLGKRRWGEQCGALETYAQELLDDLPDARVVHLVRDPLTSYRLAARRTGNGPGRLGRFTARWVVSAELAWANALRFPERYLIVQYESLASRTDATMRTICSFLEEPVGDDAFVFGGQSRPGREGGPTGVAHKYTRNAAATGTQCGGEEERFVAAHAARQLRLLGYPAPTPASRLPKPAYLTHWPANRFTLAMSRAQAPTTWPSWPGG